MIEREFVLQKTKEYYIKRYIEEKLNRVGISQIRLKKIPLGEKIIIDTSRPSLVVGSKGANIKDLTKVLKKKFNLENPQVEINEIKNIFLDANVVAEQIASSLERFGSARFKGVGHKMMENVMKSGAMGVEIIISGKIPGARAKSWRFYQGYLKKCGDVAISEVRKAQKVALLKSGIIGIKVAIMPPDLVLPDKITVREEPVQVIEKVEEEVEEASGKKKVASKKPTKKKVSVGKELKKTVGEKKEASEKKVGRPKVKTQRAAAVKKNKEDVDNSSSSEKEKPVAERMDEKRTDNSKDVPEVDDKLNDEPALPIKDNHEDN